MSKSDPLFVGSEHTDYSGSPQAALRAVEYLIRRAECRRRWVEAKHNKPTTMNVSISVEDRNRPHRMVMQAEYFEALPDDGYYDESGIWVTYGEVSRGEADTSRGEGR